MHNQPVSGDAIQAILHLFKARKKFAAKTPGMYKEQLMVPEYIALLKRLFPHLVGLDMSVVFDTGHSAVGAVLPDLIKVMQWKNTHTLCAEVDSSLAIHEADPTSDNNVQDLKQAVQSQKALLGIGFDGDGDRMGAVTDEGHLLPGDRLLALFSKPLLQKLPGARIAFDIKCSSILNETIQKWGGRVHVSPSGHSFIKEAMRKHNAVLAGELSCHFFFNDRYFGFDDGIYAALRLLELLLHSQSTLAKLLKEIPHRENSPELRIACGRTSGSAIVQAVKQKFLTEKDVKITTIDGVRVDTQDGWGLVRASNTQPVICIRFESRTKDGLKRMREKFVQALEPCFEKEEIGKKITWPGI
jgi:phosphomannomutase/phosphoglucomutase